MELDTFVTVVRIAMDVLSKRILHLLTILLSAFLFGWMMYQPDILRLVAAIAFTCLMIVLSYVGGMYASRDTR